MDMKFAPANRVVGENGAPAMQTTGAAIVDLFFELLRGLEKTKLDEMFEDVVNESKNNPDAFADLCVLSLQTRDCRGGKGERDLFYHMLELISAHLGTATTMVLLPLVPTYGYYKDLLTLAVNENLPATVKNTCLSLYVEALKADELELAKATEEKRTPKLTLAGKYAPREGGAFDKKHGLATEMALKLNGAINKPAALRKYRKLVSALNAALNTPEVYMAAWRFAEIKFASVASLCLQRHRKAFLNEALKGKVSAAFELTGNRKPDDADRVAARAHLREAMASKGVKGKQLMPHEVVQKLMHSEYGRRSSLSTAEKDLMCAQWAALRKGVQEALESLTALKAALPKRVDLGKLVALVDVSGSMHGTPMEVAIALGLLVSELSAPAYANRVLTFESVPNWVNLSGCTDIAEKVAKVQSAPWGGSTDFAAACERILDVAENAKLTPDAIPDLIVFSDMQFDMAGGIGSYPNYSYYYGCGRPASARATSWETHYERLERRFAEVGQKICGQPYAPPKIIFWNLRANTVGFPVQKDAPNTQMLSGFSPALLKLVLTCAELVVEEEEVVQADGSVEVKRSGPTPEQTLRSALDDTAYDAVRLALSEVKEGPLAAYTFAAPEAATSVDDFELV